jgi:hypothetical protein
MAPLKSLKNFTKGFTKLDALKIAVVGFLVLFALYERYKVFDESGGELETNRRAVQDLLKGDNTYGHTMNTYERADEYEDHGYAYLPSLMYTYAPFFIIWQNTEYPLQRLWKIPVLLADLAVGAFLFFYLYKKDYLLMLVALAMWFFNPYFVVRGSYTYTEPLGIFFMMLALYFLGTKDILAGVFYGAAFSYKAFPIVLFPLFLLKSKKPLKFLLSGAIFGLIVSLPFLKSVKDATYYVKGAFLVHGDRPAQGRPFLFYIQHYTGLPIFNAGYTKIYTWASILLGWSVSVWAHLRGKLGGKLGNKYVLTMFSFIPFYLFTPVLNRTYLIWFIPVYVLGLYNLFENKGTGKEGRRPYLASVALYALLFGFYIFYAWYLGQWVRGVRVLGTHVTF